MGECVLRIEKLENGFEVEIADPEAKAKNSKSTGIYEDPWKAYAFVTVAEVVKFIDEKLGSLKAPEADEEYSGAFAEAIKDD